MIKRTAAIFFILLANISLLAHAVIQHHHHSGIICNTSSHCQTDIDVQHPNKPEHNHKHGGNSGANYCTLNQEVELPRNVIKAFSSYKDKVRDNNTVDLFGDVRFVFLRNAFLPPVFFKTTVFTRFDSFFSSQVFLSSGLGLRAPPIV